MRARCSHNVLRFGKYAPHSIVRRIASSYKGTRRVRNCALNLCSWTALEMP